MKSTKSLEEKKMKTSIKAAVVLVIMATSANAWNWEKPGNPDRFISLGLNLDYDKISGGYGPLVDDNHYMQLGESVTKLTILEADIRFPLSDNATLYGRVRADHLQDRFNSQNQAISSDVSDQKGTGFGVGVRVYLK